MQTSFGLTWRLLLLAVLALAAVGGLFSRPPLPQDLTYHRFADQRAWLGIPNFNDVVSNLPFLLVGILGVRFVLRRDLVRDEGPFLTSVERWPYLLFFLGIAGTAVGSAYYHLTPDNPRLVWDRLPMAVAFMALFCAILSERLCATLGRWLLGPLLLAGVGSVAYWAWYDDLRPYYFVQFFPLAALPPIVLLFPPRYTGTRWLLGALACYVLAKVCEHPYDGVIFHATGECVSGHTLKHLLAALGAYCLLRMLQVRQPARRPENTALK
ncbi:MAG: ceramidase domain-containing protein [Planctomycetia bacterium]|nr:ceramidase domain-containing protein [Planctomycetia bacterium]